MTEESRIATTKQLKRALAALDTAIQNWYKEYVPYYSRRYAHYHFCAYPDGEHISDIILKISDNGNYIKIASSKED